jgi:hypothetical protein
MGEQVTLNGSGHHVLALAGFELLLDAADDLELPVGIDAGQIAGAEESVRREANLEPDDAQTSTFQYDYRHHGEVPIGSVRELSWNAAG